MCLNIFPYFSDPDIWAIFGGYLFYQGITMIIYHYAYTNNNVRRRREYS